MSFFECSSPPKSKTLKTRTGKDVTDSEASDLYQSNTTPPKTLLTASKVQSFTDDEDRTYWPANEVQKVTHWMWKRDEVIRKDANGFDSKTDDLYFVRNKPGVSMLDQPAPERNLQTAKFFYQFDGRFKGFIVDNGNDELYAEAKTTQYANKSQPRVRGTNYVVIRWDGARPG